MQVGLRRREPHRQLSGHFLAVGRTAAALGQHAVQAKDQSQGHLHIRRLQVGRELHAESHHHQGRHARQRFERDWRIRPDRAVRVDHNTAKRPQRRQRAANQDLDASTGRARQPPERPRHAHTTN